MAAYCARMIFANPMKNSVFMVFMRSSHRKTRDPIKFIKARNVRQVELTHRTRDKGQESTEELLNQEEDYIDHNTVLENADKFYDMHKDEQRQKRSMISKIRMRKSMFPEERESNLLMWSAKQQIFYLHGQDAQEWNPERISECFPITPEGAKRLLRSNFKWATEQEIEEHDSLVEKRWRALKRLRKGKTDNEVFIADITKNLFLEGKFWKREKFSSGNPTLPPAPPGSGVRVIQSPLRQQMGGEHFSLVENYLRLKEQKENNNEKATKTIVKSREEMEVMLETMDDVYLDDMAAATTLRLPKKIRFRKQKRSDHVTFDDIKDQFGVKGRHQRQKIRES